MFASPVVFWTEVPLKNSYGGHPCAELEPDVLVFRCETIICIYSVETKSTWYTSIVSCTVHVTQAERRVNNVGINYIASDVYVHMNSVRSAPKSARKKFATHILRRRAVQAKFGSGCILHLAYSANQPEWFQSNKITIKANLLVPTIYNIFILYQCSLISIIYLR